MLREDGPRPPELPHEINPRNIVRLASLFHDRRREADRKVSKSKIDNQLDELAEESRSAHFRHFGNQEERDRLRREGEELLAKKKYLEGLEKTEMFEPKMETTKDEAWIATHATDQVDIANTPFSELPTDLQYEDRAVAEVALKEVVKRVKDGGRFTDFYVEEAAARIHDEWLKRNGSQASIEQKKPFRELSEADKEKYRDQIHQAQMVFLENGVTGMFAL